MCAAVFHGDAGDVDPLIGQQGLFGREERRDQPGARVHERVRATASGILERHYLHDDELEGM